MSWQVSVNNVQHLTICYSSRGSKYMDSMFAFASIFTTVYAKKSNLLRRNYWPNIFALTHYINSMDLDHTFCTIVLALYSTNCFCGLTNSILLTSIELLTSQIPFTLILSAESGKWFYIDTFLEFTYQRLVLKEEIFLGKHINITENYLVNLRSITK